MPAARTSRPHRSVAQRPLGLPESLAAFILAAIALAVIFGAVRNMGSEPDNADRASILTARAMIGSGGQAAPASLRPPGYPLVLTTLANLNSDVAAALGCASEPPRGCGARSSLYPLAMAQVLAAILTLVIIYLLAHELSGSSPVALITLILAYCCGRYGDTAGGFFGETWYAACALATLYLLATGAARHSPLRHFGAGIGVGATALFEPTFLVTILAAAVPIGAGSGPLGRRLRAIAFILSGCLLTLAALLSLALSLNYDLGGIGRHMVWQFSERVAFNQLDAVSWWAGLLLPVPFVSSLVSSVLPERIIASFGYYTAGTFVYDGTNRIFPAALGQPGAPIGGLLWIAKTYVLLEPWNYIASSVPLLMRGLLGATGVIGLVGLLHVPRMLKWSAAEAAPTASAIRCVFLCTAALLIANSVFTANPAGINPTLPFLFAFAIAYVAAGL